MNPQCPIHGMDKIEVSVSRAAIKIVGTDHRTHEFLEDIEIFVRASCGNKPSNGLRSVLCFDGTQSAGRCFQGIDPRSGLKSCIGSDQWFFQAGRAINKLKAESSPHTDTVMTIDRIRSVAPLIFPREWRRDADDFCIFSFHIDLAAVTTVIARGCRLFELPGFVRVLGKLIGNGTHRADR